MKKIIHIIDGLGIGGAERLLVDLVTRLPKTDYEVHVVWLTADRNAFVDQLHAAGIATTCIPKRTKVGLQMYRTLKQFLIEEKPDIVHTHLFASDVWGTLAASAAGVKYIVSTDHNIDRDYGWLRQSIKAWARKRVDHVVAVSEAVRGAVIAESGSVISQRVSVIYNAIDTKAFVSPVERNNAIPVIAVIGRLEEQKGHALFLKAVRQMRSSCQVRIIGNGSLRQMLVNRVNQLGLGNTVRFEPAMTDIASVYQEVDVVVVPSQWEGFGLVAVEAMASGCAVVASRVDGLVEIISSGVDGILVDMQYPDRVAGAIDLLLSHPQQRLQLALAGQQTALKRFDIAGMVVGYEAMYQKFYEGPASQ